MTAKASTISVVDFRGECRAWLAKQGCLRSSASTGRVVWGEGSDNVGTYGSDDDESIRQALLAERAWQREKYASGFGAIAWSLDAGGRGLTAAHQAVFDAEEARFDVPAPGETLRISLHFIAPVIAQRGTAEQMTNLIVPLLRADVVACLLLSEPDAGSDLGSLQTRAIRDGADWVLDGQKVWSSGTRFCDLGLSLVRTREASGASGLTAFVVPLDSHGVVIRPLRQMTGESYFNEVFLQSALVPDSYRIGEVGNGWEIVMTAMAIDRGDGGAAGKDLARFLNILTALAEHHGTGADLVVRQALAKLHTDIRILGWLSARVQARATGPVGAEGSLLKLAWAAVTSEVSEVACLLLGAKVIADTGEWATYAWTSQILGAPSIHIAGGTDEIQRSVLAERVLGLPREPR